MEFDGAFREEEREDVDRCRTRAGVVEKAVCHGFALIEILVSSGCQVCSIKLIEVEACDLRAVKCQTTDICRAGLPKLEYRSRNQRQLCTGFVSIGHTVHHGVHTCISNTPSTFGSMVR